MTPISTLRTDSPLGAITLAASDQGLCGLWFEAQKHAPTPAQQACWHTTPNHPLLQQVAALLQDYWADTPSRVQGFAGLALDLSAGTPFQQSVWRALLDIPAGHSQSYGDLARRIHKPQAVRAVGAAVGRNPVSIIVPCHRILGATGQLTGYAGGVWRKQALLQHEGHPAAA